jgi:hypothetical protein
VPKGSSIVRVPVTKIRGAISSEQATVNVEPLLAVLSALSSVENEPKLIVALGDTAHAEVSVVLTVRTLSPWKAAAVPHITNEARAAATSDTFWFVNMNELQEIEHRSTMPRQLLEEGGRRPQRGTHPRRELLPRPQYRRERMTSATLVVPLS